MSHALLAFLADRTQALNRILDDDLQPIVVFDDTDRWLNAADAGSVTGFFGETIRWLATTLPGSVVVATHVRYLEDDAAGGLLEFLDTRIDVPAIPDAAGVATILSQRLACNVAGTPHAVATLGGVVAGDAVDALFDV